MPGLSELPKDCIPEWGRRENHYSHAEIISRTVRVYYACVKNVENGRVRGKIGRQIRQDRGEGVGNKVKSAVVGVKWGYTISYTLHERNMVSEMRPVDNMGTRNAGQKDRTTDIIKGREGTEKGKKRKTLEESYTSEGQVITMTETEGWRENTDA